MKRFTVIAVVLLLCVGIVFGQDVTPKTKQGDKAWVFGWNGLSSMGVSNFSTIGTSAGSVNVVGGRYYWQDNMALRAGIGFQSAGTAVLSGGASPTLESKSTTGYGIVLGVQDDYEVSGPVAAYIGGQFAYGSFKPHDVANPSGSGYVSVDARSSFGIGVFTGAEWFPWSHISFAPEVQLMYTSMNNGQTTIGSSTVDIPASTSFGLNTNASLWVSLYF